MNIIIRKLRKLMRHPRAFFADRKRNVSQKNKKGDESTRVKAPDWYRSNSGKELNAALESGHPIFLYVPWIEEHSNSLISKIRSENKYRLSSFDFAEGIEKNAVRRTVSKFARENPHVYRKLIAKRLVPLRGRITGVVFTFDWAPVMRVIASVCEELEIPRILIPHESVFVDREKYYWDPTAFASIPSADIVMGWGQLQKQIFVERGYPADRFLTVGAPKFDTYFDYRATLSRKQFCSLFGLNAEKKIVLFASQPLDSQLDQEVARESQRQAIHDLLDLTDTLGYQLLVRLPPSKEEILGNVVRARIDAMREAAIDESMYYLVPPEEMLFHADLVTSINSTMMFEGLLLGRPALSVKYVEFDQIWEQVGIPVAKTRSELTNQLQVLTSKDFEPCSQGMTWAAQMFGVGSFDGQACNRIRMELERIAATGLSLGLRPAALARVFAGAHLDVIGSPSSDMTVQSSQRFLTQMLLARTRVNSVSDSKFTSLASVELFIQWGITESLTKKRQREKSIALGKPVLILEDGFIRSVDIGLSGEPGLSIIMDDITAYYDATCPSRLQRLLEHGDELQSSSARRSRAAIEKIVQARVSKYNHAPNLRLKIGSPNRRKVMLVDQRYGDQSVASGLADESTFERMLQDVISQRADCDIIIKQHPDAIKGGKSSYYSNLRLAAAASLENIYPITFDINPYALFDLVDEVYVVTSGMGFEALMAGKVVYCYGAPFYAGWGVTNDKLVIPGRSRKRSVEDLFHFAYIESSRYFHPVRNRVVQVEELVEHIVEARGW